MNAKLITAAEASTITARYAGSVAEAARMLGVSETTIRRTARMLGVSGLRSKTVAGLILIEATPMPVTLRYGSAA